MSLEPDAENHPAYTSDDIRTNEGNDGGTGLPPVITPPNPPQPPGTPNQPADDTDRWWNDRKYVLELCGFIVLFLYTIFAGLQWWHIRWANTMMREALSGNNSSLQQTLDRMTWQIKETHEIAKQTLAQATQTTKLATDTHELAVQAKNQADASKTIATDAGTQAQAASNLAISAGEQAKASKSIADLTLAQLNLTQKQFETSQRPWISVPSASLLLYLWQSPTDLNIQPKIEFTNVGNLPASEVHVFQKMFFVEISERDFLKSVKEKQRLFCEQSIREGYDWQGNAQVLYPGKSGTYSRASFEGRVEKNQIFIRPNVPPFVSGVLIGCVIYRFASSPSIHQSGFIFLIDRKDAPTTGIGLSPGEAVPIGDVVLEDAYNGDAYND